MVTATVKGVFLRQREYGICWPGNRYDTDGHIQEYTEKLLRMGEKLGVNIECKAPFYDDSDVAKLESEEKEHPSDGILILALGLRTWGSAERIASIGRPTVIFTPLFCFSDHIRELSRREGVYLISTLDFDTVEYGIRMIKAAKQLQSSRIIVLKGDEPAPKDTEIPPFGTKVRTIARRKFVDELNNIVETEEVLAIASEYIQKAEKVVEPKREDVINAAKTYFASKNILRKFEGDAISLDCLGLLGAGLIHTTPCLGFSRLNDEGLPAGCEADMNSILTMVLLRHLFSKPGFIADPTVDTVKNRWIGSHCTSPTKLSGIGGQSEPFLLRGYAHLDLGVSPQVIWREGQEVTLIKFRPNENIMKIGKGKAVGNIDFAPPANMCITSVEVEVDDVEDMRDVEGSIHVVLMYGNHLKELSAFCQLMGISSSTIEAFP
jgi:L-fucose isomerase-like protein